VNVKTSMKLALSILLAALSVGAVACGDHYTTQEAYTACEEILNVRPDAAGDDVIFAECVACHETCGSECEPLGTVPATFDCPED
jgi:hypothetical protein